MTTSSVSRPRDRAIGTLAPLPDRAFGFEEARHLLARAGFGGTPDQVEALVEMGLRGAVDHLLEVEKIPFDDPPRGVNTEIMRPLTPAERQEVARARRRQDEDTLAAFRLRRQQAQRDDRRQMASIQRWWLARMIETPRPLEERMTLFWHGHFATSYRTIENSYHMLLQNATLRRHALGSFANLLHSIIRDPAMLAYLDNNRSRRGSPNENLARELMELFSLGVGQYTERDIREGARALTGYTFEHNEFVFNNRWHDAGSKRILGQSGALDGDGFARAILAHPACATFVASRLYRHFVAELPGDLRAAPAEQRAFVSRLGASLRENGYQLRPMLRRMFMSQHFYHAGFRGEQIKSPAQLVVGAVRSLGVPVRDLGTLLDAMDLMGQSLFYPPSVKGWDGGRAWINTATVYVRQNTLAFLLTGRAPAGRGADSTRESYDPRPLFEPLAEADPDAARDPARVAEYTLRLLLGRAPDRARRTLESFVRTHGTDRPDALTGLLLLATACPEYQLC